jgi:hypothetical protein
MAATCKLETGVSSVVPSISSIMSSSNDTNTETTISDDIDLSHPSMTFIPWTQSDLEMPGAFETWVLGPLFRYIGINSTLLTTLSEIHPQHHTTHQKSSIQRRYLRTILAEQYEQSILVMSSFLGQKTVDELSRMIGDGKMSMSTRSMFVAGSSIVDNLYMLSIEQLEQVNLPNNGGAAFPKLQDKVCVDRTALSMKDQTTLLDIGTDYMDVEVSQVIHILRKSCARGETIKQFMKHPLKEHSFLEYGKHMTVGSVLARVAWATKMYPEWVTILLNSKHYVSTKRILTSIANNRKLPLPFHLSGESTRLHGKFIESQSKNLTGSLHNQHVDQTFQMNRLSDLWTKFKKEKDIQASELRMAVHEIHRLGIDVNVLEQAVGYIKKRCEKKEEEEERGVRGIYEDTTIIKRRRKE